MNNAERFDAAFQIRPNERCPGCWESRVAYLVWNYEGTAVTCQSCGTVYVPGRVQDDAHDLAETQADALGVGIQ